MAAMSIELNRKHARPRYAMMDASWIMPVTVGLVVLTALAWRCLVNGSGAKPAGGHPG